MYTKVTIQRHPIHPMLVVLPIGMWVFSLIGDIVLRMGGSPAWAPAAYYAMGIGIIGALTAAVFGFIDLLSIPEGTRARGIGYWHLGINLSVTVLFIVNFYLRSTGPPVDLTPFILSIVGIAALLVSGWLGGEMVYVEGVAVRPAAKSSGVEVEEEERLRKAA
ncbi:MAG: DUF2231 domain-containing protein [Nitrospirota bacterium]